MHERVYCIVKICERLVVESRGRDIEHVVRILQILAYEDWDLIHKIYILRGRMMIVSNVLAVHRKVALC